MLAPNTVLQDRYKITALLGRGGMGAVYEAVDQKFGSTVAIKQTLVTGDELARAFEREARLLNKLRHRALPMVMDYFTEGDGQFLVMQYIPGDDLAALGSRNDGPFPEEQILRWADQLLDALSYLHEHEPPIIHRDIKPQNLKLTPRGEVILLDFGLSKSAAAPGAVPGTTSVSVLGYTPHYAPFEQINSVGTDPRSDLFSLAATLYHLVTGVLPPDSMTRAQRVMNGLPDPLRAAHEVNDAVTPAVGGILLGAMAIKRDHRPASASVMQEALRAAKQGSRSAAHAGAHEPASATMMMPTIITPPSDPRPPSTSGAAVANTNPPAPAQDSRPPSTPGTAAAPAANITVPASAALASEAQGQPGLAAATPRPRSWLRPLVLAATVVVVAGVVLAGARQIFKAQETASPQSGSIQNPPPVAVQTTSLPEATFKFETAKLSPNGSMEEKRMAFGKFYEEDLGSGTRLDMVSIPAGKYLMGTPDSDREYPDEQPQHEVSVPEFYLGEYEVTQAQWRAVAKLPKVRLDLNADPSEFKGDDLPVESISWNEANEFCARVSQKAHRMYRLPSEAEWEYAARAGTRTAFAFGDSVTTALANFDGSAPFKSVPRGISRAKTIPVGSLKFANAFGLYDMHGNVWEWCFAKYHDSYKDAPTDGSSWAGGGDVVRRVVRGGSWSNLGVDCRSANRYSYAQDGRHNDIGLRIAMSNASRLD